MNHLGRACLVHPADVDGESDVAGRILTGLRGDGAPAWQWGAIANKGRGREIAGCCPRLMVAASGERGFLGGIASGIG